MEEKFMRVLVMFDMPTCSKKERKDYAKFRKSLIKDGFMMLQYSVFIFVPFFVVYPSCRNFYLKGGGVETQ